MKDGRSRGELSRTLYFVLGLACGSLTVGWGFFHEQAATAQRHADTIQPDAPPQEAMIKIANGTDMYVAKPEIFAPPNEKGLFGRSVETCEAPFVFIRVPMEQEKEERQVCVLPPHLSLDIHPIRND